MLWYVSETLLSGAQGAHSRRRKPSWAARTPGEGRVHWRGHGVMWSARRSKAKQGDDCSAGEQSPLLEHTAVGNIGTGKPARAK